jgi:hypothetical protein
MELVKLYACIVLLITEDFRVDMKHEQSSNKIGKIRLGGIHMQYLPNVLCSSQFTLMFMFSSYYKSGRSM